MGLFSTSNSFLGIDIGSSSIKIVELQKEAGDLKLLTYGFTENIGEIVKDNWASEVKHSAILVNKMSEKAGAMSRTAIASLPTYSVFSSIINLTNIEKKDISSAINLEAKKVIPIPLEEMILDWKIINSNDEKIKKTQKNIKVLLTGAPKNLVKKYIDIFSEAKINLLSLETEIFSLIRSLIGNDKSTIMIIEIGMSTTDISIVSNGISIMNRSIEAGGSMITRAISNSLNIGMERAEQFKYDLGMSEMKSANDVIPKTIIDAINPIINEVKHMINFYQEQNNKNVEKIILSGGSSSLPNFTDYLSKLLNINVVVGNPWEKISYPIDLEPVLKEIGPRLAVAVGLAIRGVE